MVGEVPKRTKQRFSTTAFIPKDSVVEERASVHFMGKEEGQGWCRPVQADAERVCGQEHKPAVLPTQGSDFFFLKDPWYMF